MASDELLRRIDAHMSRGNELMELNREAFERNVEASERNREAFDEVKAELVRCRESHLDLRHFIRDITRRNEVVHREVVGELREIRAETKAQTRAIFALIDRLEGGGLNPAT